MMHKNPVSDMGKRVFLYPINKDSIKEQNNNYVKQLIVHLGKEFKIINGVTEVGLLDALLKFRRTDVYYFNWIENIPAKRFGFFQVLLLPLLLALSKVAGKKVVWFVHNNISHDKRHYQTKKLVVNLMARFADLILSHSNEITLHIPKNKLHVFHHPIEGYQPVSLVQPCQYDLVVWGSVYPYKGVAEFVKYVSASQFLRTQKIIIAGKFSSDEYYGQVERAKTDNITIVNEFITEEQLRALFSQTRYILFTYASASVLSSAALCKSLSFGKEVIAPDLGSFKELGAKNLIYTYQSFQELEELLKRLEEGKRKTVERASLLDYIQNTNWNAFSSFVFKRINFLYAK